MALQQADIQIFVTNYINENDLHIQNSLIVAIVCLLSFYRPIVHILKVIISLI